MTIADSLAKLKAAGMIDQGDIVWKSPDNELVTFRTPIAAFKNMFPTVEDLRADTQRGFAPLVQQLQAKGIM